MTMIKMREHLDVITDITGNLNGNVRRAPSDIEEFQTDLQGYISGYKVKSCTLKLIPYDPNCVSSSVVYVMPDSGDSDTAWGNGGSNTYDSLLAKGGRLLANAKEHTIVLKNFSDDKLDPDNSPALDDIVTSFYMAAYDSKTQAASTSIWRMEITWDLQIYSKVFN